MKYPKNPKEAEKVLEEYRLSLIDENPLIITNLKSDISADKDEVDVMDVMLIDGTPCESPLICVKSVSFDLCDQSQKELEINTTYLEVRDFLSAADAISTFIYSRREIDEVI